MSCGLQVSHNSHLPLIVSLPPVQTFMFPDYPMKAKEFATSASAFIKATTTFVLFIVVSLPVLKTVIGTW